jgi:hypothetical protein
MLDYQKSLQIAFKEPVTDELAYESVKTVFKSSAREVTECLLYKDEAKLPAGIEGSKSFSKAFQSTVPRSASGLSLKELDLTDHLFKNRCSYLIYSESFMALPELLKKQIYARLAKALDPEHPDPDYSYIDSQERGRIRSILHETHPAFRTAWNNLTAQKQ